MKALLTDPALDEELKAAGATLPRIAFAMAFGIVALAAVDVVVYCQTIDVAPTPESLRAINLLTTIAMACALGGIFVSEMLWRAKVRAAAPETLAKAVFSAFILRSAIRQGAALLGAVVVLLAARGGVLRLYPAYWTGFAPAALFGTYLWVHWPTAANLKAELAEVLGD